MAEHPLETSPANGVRDDVLLSIVYSLYRTIHEVDRWPLILSQVQDVLSARAFCLAIHDFQRRSGRIAIHSGCFSEAQATSYNQTHGRHDPWLIHQEVYRTSGLTWVGDELIPRSRLAVSDFYTKWLQPQNLLHQCSGVLLRDNEHLVYLRAYRSADQPPFKRHELYPLQRLLPHLRQTLELHHLIAGGKTGLRTSIAQFVAQLGATQSIRDVEHQMLLNRSQNDEPSWSDLPLSEAVPQETSSSPPASVDDIPGTATQEQPAADPGATDDDASAGLRASLPLRGITNEGALAARGHGRRNQRWLPILLDTAAEPEHAATATAPDGSGTPPHDCDTGTDENQARLKQLYSLTPSEAKLAELLASGTDLPKAAMLLGIGLSTVRTHLQRIYSKTDTHHQSALVALLLAGPARLRVEYCNHNDDDDELERSRPA